MIDIHTHTRYSDGSDSVAQLLQTAEKAGVRLLSVTDHNTVSAYQDIQMLDVPSLYRGRIITGCELQTVYNGITIEILGYGMDTVKIRKHLSDIYRDRIGFQQLMYDLMCQKCAEIGIQLCLNDSAFDPTTMSARLYLFNHIRRSPENRTHFLFPESMDNYNMFIRYESCNPKSPFYLNVTSLVPSPAEVVTLINHCGGTSFLAHPFVYMDSVSKDLDRLFDESGLEGLECYYNSFTRTQTEFCRAFTERRNLFRCGGSDYHGTRRPGVAMGTGRGNLAVPEEDILHWAKMYL